MKHTLPVYKMSFPFTVQSIFINVISVRHNRATTFLHFLNNTECDAWNCNISMVSQSDEFHMPLNGRIKSQQSNPCMLVAFASELNVSLEPAAFHAAALQDASTYL